MVNSILRTAFINSLAILLLFAALAPVYSRGSRDQDLVRADALIADRDYDEAILVLTDFIRRNPNRFDQAQVRLRRITQIREEFNLAANELIETLINDPGNDERLLELTIRLNELERETSPLLATFLSRRHEIAQFNVNRNLLFQILETGRELLDRGDGTAAIQNYARGMGIMRDEFFTAGHGEEIENEVLRQIEIINALLASFSNVYSQMRTISAELNRAINAENMTGITQSINRLTPVAGAFTGLKNELHTAADTFNRILAILRAADPYMGDLNHIAFLSGIINGREGEDIQEGMLGAFDLGWRITVGSNLETLLSLFERTNAASFAAFNAGQFAAIMAAAGRTENLYGLTGQFFDMNRLFFEGGQPQTITLFGDNILVRDMPLYLELKALNEANNSLMLAANAAIHLNNTDRSSIDEWQSGNLTATAALAAERQERNNITALQREMENITADAVRINTEINTYHDVIHITNALDAINSIRAAFYEEELLSVQRYYTVAHNNLRNYMNARRNEINRGNNFLDGERRVSQDGTVTYLRYPAEALEVFTATVSALSVDLQNENRILAQFRNEPQTILSDENISALFVNYQAAVNELNAMHNQTLTLAETARLRANQAEAHRLEAERLFTASRAAYQRQNFDLARDFLHRAAERINSALELQASAELGSYWDSRLLALGQEISGAENEFIIAEVRELINTASALHFAGNFQQAQYNLERARNRWGVTNSEENEEINHWLGLVRNAQTGRQDRTISHTAPLFAEMSQLLSQAQRNYNEGVRHINAGQRSAGLVKFEEARQMTREVRLIFPQNEAAGVLELMIEQFIDPPAFNAAFGQRIRTAIEGTRQGSVDAFAELQNLAVINPNYPNIRAILTQAEIDMGIRPPFPNPADIARSRELTASTRQILDQNITALFPAALAQIDEAILLDSNNTEATAVKDRLLSRMNVPDTIVLSREDEEIYQRAVREHHAGNNIVANALVEGLMQNPRNRNITKLVELQQRIRVVL